MRYVIAAIASVLLVFVYPLLRGALGVGAVAVVLLLVALAGVWYFALCRRKSEPISKV